MTRSTDIISEQEQQVQHKHHIKQMNGTTKVIQLVDSSTTDLNQNEIYHHHHHQHQNYHSTAIQVDAKQALNQFKGTRIGVALIGLGRMGLIHLSNILQEVEAKLLYCFDTDTQGLKEKFPSALFFEEFGVETLHCQDFQIALNDPKVEAVIIATPTKFHELYIRRALEAGKTVLCEKPLTSKTESILPLYELAKQKKVSLMCAFNRRYDPDFRNVRARSINREQSGDIQLIKITSRDPTLPPMAYLKVSGGLLHDSVVHDIDMSMWLMRQLPVQIQVTGKTFEQYFRQNQEAYMGLSAEDRTIADTLDDFFLVLVTLTFPDGSICVIDNARQSNYGYDQRIEVCCSKTMLKFDGKTPLDVVEYGAEGRSNPPIHVDFANRYKTAYLNELKDLVTMSKLTRLGLQTNRQAQREVLLEPNRPMLVYATHRTADAGLESWRSSGRPVEIKWSPEIQSQFSRDIM